MDINKSKTWAQNKIESDSLAKQVRKTKSKRRFSLVI